MTPLKKCYQKLQKHLNSLPIGYPRTPSGAEIKILQHVYTPTQARLALALDLAPRTAPQILCRLPQPPCYPNSTSLKEELDAMAARGGVLRRNPKIPGGEDTYSLMPFVVGFYEMQIPRMNREFVSSTFQFAMQGYGLEYLAADRAQSRIIPLDDTIANEHRVATYDEYERLIRNAEGHIALTPCVCRLATDLLNRPCRYTDRREICLGLNDLGDHFIREGWGRAVSVEEALRLSRQNQQEGLVIQCANDQEPHFLCACCGDCCGILGMVKAAPRPVDHIEFGYQAVLDTAACRRCGLCLEKCPMDALTYSGKDSSADSSSRLPRIDRDRCIGCGVCTAACPAGALRLEPRPRKDPPADVQELYTLLDENRKPLRKLLRKLSLALRIGLRMARERIAR